MKTICLHKFSPRALDVVKKADKTLNWLISLVRTHCTSLPVVGSFDLVRLVHWAGLTGGWIDWGMGSLGWIHSKFVV